MNASSLDQTHLNPEQLQAVQTVHGPLLIVAGAGSGKTRVITYRIAFMLDHHIPQSQILALTFTNKAAREMEGRVKELTGRPLTNLTVSTFHSFGLQVLRENVSLLGRGEELTVYDTADVQALIRQAAEELKLELDRSEAASLAALFSAVKNGLARLDDRDEWVQRLFHEYEDHMRLYGAVDFDDLINLPLRLWESYPDLLEAYRQRYRYILVDEFQDTSLNQYALVRMLALQHRNLCVVGDDDQSIYSWRGANYRNIQEFERDFPERVEIKLEKNYRSTGVILAAANAVINNNHNRKTKELKAVQPGGGSLELYIATDEEDEAVFIARTIKALFVREKRSYSDFGVLVRTNSLTRPIELVFLRERIPYSISGGTSFLERREIKDVVSYLRCLLNPEDDLHFLRILNVPRRGLGKTTLELLRKAAQNRGLTAWEAARLLAHPGAGYLPSSQAVELAALVDLLERYRQRLQGGKTRHNARLTRELLEDIGYREHLEREGGSERAIEWRWQNVSSFLELLESWENDPSNSHPSLNVFLNRLALSSRDDDEGVQDRGSVNVMTIHSAKGLEFPVVFLPALEEGILPHERSLSENPEALEEERRLFYVALTRAQQRLFLSFSQARKGQRELNRPSPFLQEIPEGLVKQVTNYDTFEKGEMERLFDDLKRRLGLS